MKGIPIHIFGEDVFFFIVTPYKIMFKYLFAHEKQLNDTHIHIIYVKDENQKKDMFLNTLRYLYIKICMRKFYLRISHHNSLFRYNTIKFFC